MKVEFYRHSLSSKEIASIADAIGSLFLTTGPRTDAFEKAFAELLGVDHVIGVSSCTDGLFICLKAWGIGPGDRVVVPAQTFVASSNVVLHAGAEPVFCDVEKRTGCLDLDCLETILSSDPSISAVIPVHLYGHMVDMRRLRMLADRYDVKLLEDAAHCIEGQRDGSGPGQIGDAAAFSFYATKNITCGEGGALATNDGILAQTLRRLRLHGMDKSAAQRHVAYRHWDMIELGYKANMNDLQASLLIPQLPGIQERLARRESICQRYENAFSNAGIRFPVVLPGTLSARHLFTIHVDPAIRDDVLARLQSRGIGIAVNYRAVHLRQYYRDRYGYGEGRFPVAEHIGDSTISLPLYPDLKDAEVQYIIDKTIEACQDQAFMLKGND
jgi:dTDP-4-amino-4,6-dideoxygalactose transaminase